MEADQTIGILLHPVVLRRALVGLSTYERLDLYRRLAVGTDGFKLVLFALNDVNVAAHTLRGYVPARHGWSKVEMPVPRVIHKRVLHRRAWENAILRRWQRGGTLLVNPPFMSDKMSMHSVLSLDADVRPHLPPTERATRSAIVGQLERGTSMIVKPRLGSVGAGVKLIQPLHGPRAGRVLLIGAARRLLSRRRLLGALSRFIAPERYIVQQYIPLARLRGRPVDLRVAVQRDASGRWLVVGMVAKVAGKHPFLTNVARGGRTFPIEAVLSPIFGQRAETLVRTQVHTLSLAVAKAVGQHWPTAADLGLDVAVDRDGRPWLLEVNARDQRLTFAGAGMDATVRALYRNPVAFCAQVAQTGVIPN